LEEKQKNRKLTDLLDALHFNQVIIFVKSVNRSIILNQVLVDNGFPSICIHRDLSQEDRLALIIESKSTRPLRNSRSV